MQTQNHGAHFMIDIRSCIIIYKAIIVPFTATKMLLSSAIRDTCFSTIRVLHLLSGKLSGKVFSIRHERQCFVLPRNDGL